MSEQTEPTERLADPTNAPDALPLGYASPSSEFVRHSGDWQVALRRHIPYVLIIALGLLAMHLSSILKTYGYVDDYALLNMSTSPNPQERAYLQDIYLANGRAILGYLTEKSLGWAGNVEGLSWLRGIASMLQWGLGLCIYGQLIRHRRGRLESALTTLMILSIPAYVLYVGWGGTYVAVHLSLLLTFLAYVLMPRSIKRGQATGLPVDAAPGEEVADQPSPREGFMGRLLARAWNLRGLCRVIPSCLLMVVAMLIYQPTSGLFWFWVAMGLLLGTDSLRQLLMRFGIALVTYFCSGALYYIAWKCTLELMTTEASAERSQVIHTYAALQQKLNWFIHEVVPNSLYFGFFEQWNRSTTACWYVGLFIVGIAVLGVCLAIFGRGEHRPVARLMRYLLVLLIIPLSYFPNLVVVESFATFRTRVALSSILMLLLAGALSGLLWTVFRGRWNWIGRTLFAAVAMGMVIKGGYNLDRYMATPQGTEYQFVVSHARQFDFTKYDNLLIVHNYPRFFSISGQNYYYMEFGMPTSCTDPTWGGGIRTLFVRAMKEQELQLGQYPAEPRQVMEADGFYFQPVPPRTMMMDMRELVLYRPISLEFDKDLLWQMLHPIEPAGGAASVQMWISDRPSESMSFRPMTPLPATTTAPSTLPAPTE